MTTPPKPPFDKSALLFMEAGWTLMRLRPHDKVPIGDWGKASLRPDEIEAARIHAAGGGNFALRLDAPNAKTGQRLLVLDVDVKNGGVGDASYKKLKEAAPDLPEPHVRTPSGGHHTYMALPAGKHMPLNSEKYPNIDFLSGKRLAVIPPSTNAEGVPYQLLRAPTPSPMPADLPTAMRKPESAKAPKPKSPNAGLCEYAIIRMLGEIDPSRFDNDRDGWLRSGMSLHSYDASDAMREHWFQWSRRSEKYAGDPRLLADVETAWKSFREREDGVTIRYMKRLLVEGLRRRYPRLANASGVVFYDVKDKYPIPSRALNLEWARFFKDATTTMATGWSNGPDDHMVTIAGTMCAPGQPEIFEFNGSLYANEWSADSMPAPAEAAGREARAQFEFIDNHLRALCPDDDMSHSALRRWIAHQVKRPGEKVGWTPVLMGIQGSGKSSVVQLLRLLMGGRNVKPARADAVLSSFNDGVIGAPVVAIEDFSLDWRQKRPFNSNMKELVTESQIEKHEKGRSRIPVMNKTNYIMCTNDADAIIVEGDERRWFVVMRGYRSLGEFVSIAVGADEPVGRAEINAYYKRLAAIVDQENPLAGELARLFIDMEGVDALLDDHPQAPLNPLKEDMSADEGGLADEAFDALLEEGGGNKFGVWGRDAYMRRALLEAVNERLAKDGDENGVSPMKIHHMGKRRGFLAAPRYVSYGGVKRRVSRHSGAKDWEASLRESMAAHPAPEDDPYDLDEIPF